MARALVLNASYEPLSIVSSRRAVCLVIDDKAELVEADDHGVMRSATLVVPLPTVVRLRYMVKTPRRTIAAVSRSMRLSMNASTESMKLLQCCCV